MNLQYFDVISYLLDRNIRYETEGSNIAQGWIGVLCPFCMTPDPSVHLGINLHSGGISCWRCTTTGTVLKYIMKVEHVGLDTALEITKQYMNIGSYIEEERVTLPPDATVDIRHITDGYQGKDDLNGQQEWSQAYFDYLYTRNFNPTSTIVNYDLWFTGITGRWKYRIIIPMKVKGKVVSFTGRDITDQQKERYKNLEVEKSIIPVKKTLYNVDNAVDTVIVVEGPTDVWRIGNGAVAIMGTKYCQSQVAKLMQFRNVFIYLDPEPQAQAIAEQLAADLSTVVNYVEVINIPDVEDPAKLDDNDVRVLRGQLFKKIY